MNKKLVIICNYFPFEPGGSEYQAYLIAEALKDKLDIYFIHSKPNNFPIKTQQNGFFLYGIPKKNILKRRLGKSYIFDCFRVYSYLKEIDPDYIYQRIGCAYTGIAAYYSKKNKKCKSIWHIANKEDISTFKFSFSYKTICNFLDKQFLIYGIKNIDHIIAQAVYQSNLLKQNFDRNASIIIKNFHPFPANKHLSTANPPIVLWIANFKQIKQPELFIKLAKSLSNLNAKFKMIGKNSFLRDSKVFNKSNNLEYLGELPQDKVNEILSKSTVLVNTSVSEGFSNTFIQAWLRGIPVISLNANPDSIIEKYKIGFHSKTFEQLVIDTKKMVKNKKLRQAYSINSLKYAQNHHSTKNLKQIAKYFDL